MKRHSTFIAAALALASCASAPPPASKADLLIGSWTCPVAFDDGSGGDMVTVIDFERDGRMKLRTTVSMEVGEEGLVIEARGDGAWDIRPNGPLHIRIDGVHSVTAMLGDAPAPAELALETIGQSEPQDFEGPFEVSRTELSLESLEIASACVR